MLLIASTLLLGACSAARSGVDTQLALRNAGFVNPRVTFSAQATTGRHASATAIVTASRGPEGAIDRAAQIIWTKFRLRLDAVQVKVGSQQAFFTRTDLEERFGPRPAGADQDPTGDVLKGLVIVGIVGLVVVAAAVVIIVAVVRGNRRRRAVPAGGYGYGGYGGYPGQPGPPGQQGAPGQPNWPSPPPNSGPPNAGPPNWPQSN